jgi:hypothetical protein
MPVRNRGGIVQKMARAPLTPVTATVIAATEAQKFPENTTPWKPQPDNAGDKVHDLAGAGIDMSGPQDHADHRDDVAAAAHDSDFNVGELAFAKNQRQEDADGIGPDEKPELHEREDDHADIANGERESTDLARPLLGGKPVADDAAFLVSEPRHVFRTIGEQPQQAQADEDDRQPLEQKHP